jgi:hypothetical protein
MRLLNFEIATALLPLLTSVLLGNATQVVAGTKGHKAHVHGNGKIDIAVESPTHAVIELDFPGDSIFGFEHPAISAKDKQVQNDAFRKLRTQTDLIVRFDPSLACQFKANQVGIEKENATAAAPAVEAHGEDTHGQHLDINASYDVTCSKPIVGSTVTIPIMKLFPRIKKVSVQILKENGQTQREIGDGDEVISL